MTFAPPVALIGVDSSYPVAPAPLAEPAATPARVIENRAPRVLIIGDSIADQHGSHAAIALRQAGLEVQVAGAWGQSFLTRDQYDMGITPAAPPEGSMLLRASQETANFDPDITVLYSNHNYWPPYPRDAAGAEIHVGTPEFTAMVQTQLREMVRRLTVNGARVFLVEPHPVDGAPPENPFFTAYMGIQQELGLGLLHSGRVLATPEGLPVAEFGGCAGFPTPAHPDGDPLHLTYFGAGLMGTVTARGVAETLGVSLGGSTAPSEPPAVLVPAGLGYRLVTCDGATFSFVEETANLGGTALGGGRPDGDPVVAATTTGYGARGWTLTRSGVVAGLAGAPHFGNAVIVGEGQAAVGIASGPRTSGYWVATSQGMVQAFGGVRALGDLDGQGEQVVGMASSPTRQGYWLLTASGRVEGFGDALPLGDLRAGLPEEPLVGMAAHPSGQGYWLLDRAGTVYPFGVAKDLGSASNQDLARIVGLDPAGEFQLEPVPAADFPTYAVSILPTVSGEGYWVALGNGAVCHFGDAPVLGGLHLAEIQGMSALFEAALYGPDSSCSRRLREGELVVSDQPYVPRLGLLG